MAARRAHNPEAVGSSPTSATIKIPGIHYEYRDFSNFFGYFENCPFLILGQFWAKRSKNRDFGPPLCFLSDQYISDTICGLGLVFFDDVGIETFCCGDIGMT